MRDNAYHDRRVNDTTVKCLCHVIFLLQKFKAQIKFNLMN